MYTFRWIGRGPGLSVEDLTYIQLVYTRLCWMGGNFGLDLLFDMNFRRNMICIIWIAILWLCGWWNGLIMY